MRTIPHLHERIDLTADELQQRLITLSQVIHDTIQTGDHKTLRHETMAAAETAFAGQLLPLSAILTTIVVTFVLCSRNPKALELGVIQNLVFRGTVESWIMVLSLEQAQDNLTNAAPHTTIH